MTILLISSDSIDAQMAGPGIRYWEFATRLAASHRVMLLTPNRSTLRHPNVQMRQRDASTLRDALKQADVIVTQGFLFPLAPILLTDKPLVVDLYDPLPIELLEHHRHLPLDAAQLSQSYCVERTKLLLRRGDLFLYSHERQRDYWMGLLTAAGRVNHRAYRADATFDRLFACVPFGMPDEPPAPTKPVFRGAGGLFSDTDTIVLWGGGLWKWFDPCSVIRAMAEISASRSDIKLLFLGAKRASSDTTGINIAYATSEAIALSQALGVHERTVFFSDAWLPYHERQNVFAEANLGVSAHFDCFETRLSFRTRLLDYLWAGLPIISTKGDYLSELVERHQLGVTVAPQRVGELQAAMLRLTDDRAFAEQCRENIRKFRGQYTWSHVMQPLEAFCAAPHRAQQPSAVRRRLALLHFYLTTGALLIRHNGYRKILAKLKQLANIG